MFEMGAVRNAGSASLGRMLQQKHPETGKTA